MSPPDCVSALTIAAANSGGSDGIQADLKTFAALRVHGVSAISALRGSFGGDQAPVWHPLPPQLLRAQIDACFDGFDVQAAKIGMLADAAQVEVATDAIARHRPPQVVLAPEHRATDAATDIRDALRRRLLPLATLLVVDIGAAEWLLGHHIDDADAADAALDALLDAGANAVLLTCARLDEGTRIIERFGDGVSRHEFRHARLPLRARGAGTTLAAATTALLCHGAALADARGSAIDYLARALQPGLQPCHDDIRVPDHIGAGRHA